MTAAEAALREHLRASGGSVSFAEYMRFALYDGEHGYYTRRVRTVGGEGDFSTAATLHPALAQAVAAWAARHRRSGADGAGRWHLVELGGGSGEMAARVLASLGWWARRGLRYHLVEISAGLQAAQRARLERWKRVVTWSDTLAGALADSGGTALIFSNEFVDAFPCARWVFDEQDGWRELRVVWSDDRGPMPCTGAPIPPNERAMASVAGGDFEAGAAAGQEVEVFESYRRWQQQQLACWTGGRLLTIDYGDELPALYRRRPAGTMRAYCRQLRFTGDEVYARTGQQDLTADVNFTDLRRWGGELGLATESYGTQADFLLRWLPASAVRRADRDARLAYLLDPDGPGGACKVLEQVRGAQIGA